MECQRRTLLKTPLKMPAIQDWEKGEATNVERKISPQKKTAHA